MSYAECPHCSFGFDYEGDCEGFDQDSEQEFTCPKCQKEFLAIVYWKLVITGEKAKPTTPTALDTLLRGKK